MGSKVKTSEIQNDTVDLDSESLKELEKNSLLESANKFLELKKAEGIPITDSFRQLFMLNYFTIKNLDLAWRKTRGN